MKFNEIFSEDKISKLSKKRTIGIDIGSRQAKAILLADENLYEAIISTGFSMKKTAHELLDLLFKKSKLTIDDIDYIVGTGYGRIALEFEKTPHKVVTEISCHGLGAHFLGNNIHTIIDIGGQDSKAIRIDPDSGKVIDFIMNDKCAAGTGRFLEKSANILGTEVTQIGEISLHAGGVEEISSQCVVFAESEIISARAKGESVPNIAAGIHLSVARRVSNLLNRVGIEPNVLFTGGVSNNIGMKKALEEILGFPMETTKLNTVFAGALGAAIYAGQYSDTYQEDRNDDINRFELDLTDLRIAVEKAKEIYTKKATGKKKNVAYLCNYTPVEVLASANVAPIRLIHAGNKREIASGEVITKSIFCDLTKSIIGGFIEENPLYKSIDKAYTFYTCDCMRKSAEAINNTFIPTTIYNLPRVTSSESSRKYFETELKGFRDDLEKLTGEKITDEDIRKNTGFYNKAKQLLRQISEFRKADDPIICSTQYQEIGHSYFTLPVEELIPQLQDIIRQLKEQTGKLRKESSSKRPIRLMIAGGAIAEGDAKVTKIIEQEIGARVVIEDICSGYGSFAWDIEITDNDIFEDLAKGYFGKAPCARMKPIKERVDFSAGLAKDYKVDGVIYYYLKFCPSYGIIKNEFVHKFQELNIPVLEIASDYSTGDEGQLKTRIEAFVEVLGERG